MSAPTPAQMPYQSELFLCLTAEFSLGLKAPSLHGARQRRRRARAVSVQAGEMIQELVV